MIQYQTVSGTLGGVSILAINVTTSSAFVIFTVLGMVFLFLTKRSYYHYYGKQCRVGKLGSYTYSLPNTVASYPQCHCGGK